MFSKFRYLTQTHAARRPLNKAYFDKPANELHKGLTNTCCLAHQSGQTVIANELDKKHIKENTVLGKTFGDTFSYGKEYLHKVSETLPGSNVRQFARVQNVEKNNGIKSLGTVGREKSHFGMPGIFQNNNINSVQNRIQSPFSSSHQWVPVRWQHSDSGMGWLAAIRHLLYGEKEVKPLSSEIELDDIESEHNLTYLLKGCDTTEALLNLIEPKLDRRELTVKEYVDILQQLQVNIISLYGPHHAKMLRAISLRTSIRSINPQPAEPGYTLPLQTM